MPIIFWKGGSNREEFIQSAHSKLYLASLFKLNFSSVSIPNRSPLFVEEFKWEDLKVLQILSPLYYDLNCASKWHDGPRMHTPGQSTTSPQFIKIVLIFWMIEESIDQQSKLKTVTLQCGVAHAYARNLSHLSNVAHWLTTKLKMFTLCKGIVFL